MHALNQAQLLHAQRRGVDARRAHPLRMRRRQALGATGLLPPSILNVFDSTQPAAQAPSLRVRTVNLCAGASVRHHGSAEDSRGRQRTERVGPGC